MNSVKLIFYLSLGLVMLVALGGCAQQTQGEFVESEVYFQTDDSEITGTIAIPEGDGPSPAVIVLSGSGAFDRNGDVDAAVIEASKEAGVPYVVANSTYRDIAYGLSEAGMVTLRYDKRGIGNSSGEKGDFPEPSLRDLEAAISFLRDNPSVDNDKIAIVGHSLGGLWALMEAAADSDIAAICLMATPAKPFGEVIVEQIEGLIRLQGGNETDIASIVAQQRAVYAQLRSGELDPTTFPEPTRSELEFVNAIMDIEGASYAKEINSPVLILHGDKDLFTVIPEEAQLLKEAFNESGNEQVELVVFSDLDHLFRPTPGQPGSELYYENRGPIPSEVVQTIVDWMKDTLR
ncbi:MAG: alpha/beta fold hydrolase [Dehalococcoidia bacterium]|nr:alpha/beta fold hydrolase [Dehalococcoidia bacterium]